MTVSYIEIEEKKKWWVWGLFLFLILLYFAAVYLIMKIAVLFSGFPEKGPLVLFLGRDHHLLISSLVIALLSAGLHFYLSSRNLLDKMLKAIGATPLDLKDRYHKRLQNIVQEMSIVTGGKRLEARVIPVTSMNAFALADFSGRAVIGVTEGLLSRLNRSQLEAVVAHEAAHIAAGDCLMTTVSCSLFAVYAAALGISSMALAGVGESRGRMRVGGQGIAIVVAIIVILSIVKAISHLINMMVSRQREYRADSLAVKMTRDPLSLARALTLIKRGWRGSGFGGEHLKPIFIMNPVSSVLDERTDFVSELFSTHPPVAKRISLLLEMAHADLKTIEEAIKKREKGPVVEEVEALEEETKPKEVRWFAQKEGRWEGPFNLTQLAGLSWINPEAWIHREGEEGFRPAYQDPLLSKSFSNKLPKQDLSNHNCPKCHQPLTKISYESATAFRCHFCKGVLVEKKDLNKILIREERGFSPEVIKLAKLADRKICRIKDKNLWESQEISCPKCGKQMMRGFYSLAYTIEVDKCSGCGLIWFDKDELEMLQYLFEEKSYPARTVGKLTA